MERALPRFVRVVDCERGAAGVVDEPCVAGGLAWRGTTGWTGPSTLLLLLLFIHLLLLPLLLLLPKANPLKEIVLSLVTRLDLGRGAPMAHFPMVGSKIQTWTGVGAGEDK